MNTNYNPNYGQYYGDGETGPDWLQSQGLQSQGFQSSGGEEGDNKCIALTLTPLATGYVHETATGIEPWDWENALPDQVSFDSSPAGKSNFGGHNLANHPLAGNPTPAGPFQSSCDSIMSGSIPHQTGAGPTASLSSYYDGERRLQGPLHGTSDTMTGSVAIPGQGSSYVKPRVTKGRLLGAVCCDMCKCHHRRKERDMACERKTQPDRREACTLCTETGRPCVVTGVSHRNIGSIKKKAKEFAKARGDIWRVAKRTETGNMQALRTQDGRYGRTQPWMDDVFVAAHNGGSTVFLPPSYDGRCESLSILPLVGQVSASLDAILV